MKNVHRCFFPALLLLLTLTLALPVRARGTEGLVLLDTGTVREMLKPGLILLENGKSYRLDSIRIPVDYYRQAQDELGAAVLDKKVRVYASGGQGAVLDRYGVAFAYVRGEDGVWIHDHLLSKGLAWASVPDSGNYKFDIAAKIEANARAQRLGFWSDPAYAIKTPDNIHYYSNSFQIVEGKIMSVALKNDYFYINFGEDWKEDFTINMPRKSWRSFNVGSGADFDPELWRGRVIRIRGWVESRNGPMIELTSPQQIEFIKQ